MQGTYLQSFAALCFDIRSLKSEGNLNKCLKRFSDESMNRFHCGNDRRYHT